MKFLGLEFRKSTTRWKNEWTNNINIIFLNADLMRFCFFYLLFLLSYFYLVLPFSSNKSLITGINWIKSGNMIILNITNSICNISLKDKRKCASLKMVDKKYDINVIEGGREEGVFSIAKTKCRFIKNLFKKSRNILCTQYLSKDQQWIWLKWANSSFNTFYNSIKLYLCVHLWVYKKAIRSNHYVFHGWKKKGRIQSKISVKKTFSQIKSFDQNQPFVFLKQTNCISSSSQILCKSYNERIQQ